MPEATAGTEVIVSNDFARISAISYRWHRSYFQDTGVFVESGGFRFTGEAVQIRTPWPLDGNGVGWISGPPSAIPSPDPFVMSAIDGAAFDLLSMDVGENFWSNDATFDFIGFTATGGVVSRTLSIVSRERNSFVFDSTWTNLHRVEVQNSNTVAGLVLDNIVVNVVPIPAAVWLFGSGLGLLGFLRRRREA